MFAIALFLSYFFPSSISLSLHVSVVHSVRFHTTHQPTPHPTNLLLNPVCVCVCVRVLCAFPCIGVHSSVRGQQSPQTPQSTPAPTTTIRIATAWTLTRRCSRCGSLVAVVVDRHIVISTTARHSFRFSHRRCDVAEQQPSASAAPPPQPSPASAAAAAAPASPPAQPAAAATPPHTRACVVRSVQQRRLIAVHDRRGLVAI